MGKGDNMQILIWDSDYISLFNRLYISLIDKRLATKGCGYTRVYNYMYMRCYHNST